jgi:hypothetical protein
MKSSIALVAPKHLSARWAIFLLVNVVALNSVTKNAFTLKVSTQIVSAKTVLKPYSLNIS